jgi:hypothetical protein
MGCCTSLAPATTSEATTAAASGEMERADSVSYVQSLLGISFGTEIFVQNLTEIFEQNLTKLVKREQPSFLVRVRQETADNIVGAP